MQHVAWNVGSGGKEPETFNILFKNYNTVRNYYGGVGGLVVLSHANRKYDVEYAPLIIDEFLRWGITPVTVSEGMKPEDRWD